jgi:hypothetical protein
VRELVQRGHWGGALGSHDAPRFAGSEIFFGGRDPDLPGAALHVTSDDAGGADDKSFGSFAGNTRRGDGPRAKGGEETIERGGPEDRSVQSSGERNREGLTDGTASPVESGVTGKIFEAEDGVVGRGDWGGCGVAGEEEDGGGKSKNTGDKITGATYTVRGHGVPGSSDP